MDLCGAPLRELTKIFDWDAECPTCGTMSPPEYAELPCLKCGEKPERLD